MDKTIQIKPALVIIFFPQNLHEDSVWLPTEGIAFVLVHQHGRSEVSRKQAMLKLEFKIQQLVI